MSSNTNNININRKRVLVAPLDWGLGHTTRSIPVIQQLVDNGFIVFLAAEENSAYLLEKEFPNITILSLAGYKISYSKKRFFFSTKLIGQIPKILKAINKEHAWLQQIIEEHKIEIVISDNRYGLYNKKSKSIFITHQLAIETGSRFTNWLVQKINYIRINKFDECWIPVEHKFIRVVPGCPIDCLDVQISSHLNEAHFHSLNVIQCVIALQIGKTLHEKPGRVGVNTCNEADKRYSCK